MLIAELYRYELESEIEPPWNPLGPQPKKLAIPVKKQWRRRIGWIQPYTQSKSNNIGQRFTNLSIIDGIVESLILILMGKFPLTPMGSSLPICTQWRLLLVPPSTWKNNFCCKGLQSQLQTSSPTPQKSYPKFRNHRKTFENSPFVRPNIAYCRGKGGSHAKVS